MDPTRTVEGRIGHGKSESFGAQVRLQSSPRLICHTLCDVELMIPHVRVVEDCTSYTKSSSTSLIGGRYHGICLEVQSREGCENPYGLQL
jgi:hypothetical protein